MTQLDRFLRIEDRGKRVSALKDYAQSFKIKVHRLPQAGEDVNEEHLVVAIYDAEIKKEKLRQQSRKLSQLGIVGLVILSLLAFFVPRWMKRSFEETPYSGVDKKGGSFVGITENGGFVSKGVKKDAVEVMNGPYYEYGPDGTLRREYIYKQGVLTIQKNYNEDGILVSVERF